MKNIFLFFSNFFSTAALIIIVLIFSGCAELAQVAGDIAAQQAHQSAYQQAYQDAINRGLSEKEAAVVANAAAQREAEKQKQLFTGISDVASSTGEIDFQTEQVIGESLALEGFGRYGLPVTDPELQRYVNQLGNAVAMNSKRPEISYHFVVVENDLYNAFACPGGIVFVSSALINSLDDEAQLAGILAHEVAHVSHKHALKSIKRAKFFEGAGKITASLTGGKEGLDFQNMINELQSALFDKGLDKDMEFEADLAALETAYRTGYDPRGFMQVLEILHTKERDAKKEGSWFSTHPPLVKRLAKVREQMSNYTDASELAQVKERFSKYKKRL